MSKIAKEIMNDNKGSKGLGFLAGLVFGGLAGATVALIMAPQSGPQTRSLLADKSIEIKEQVAESVHHVRSQAEGAVEDVKGRVRQVEQSAQAATRAAQAAWREENSKAVAA
jgi:gas vesicle protein